MIVRECNGADPELVLEAHEAQYNGTTNVPIRRRSFVMGCVANSTDNNLTAAQVFTKTIAADPGDTLELGPNP